MKSDFVNEAMLDILVSQKKYLEAFRIYKELSNKNVISDLNKYKHLIEEVERIDPVLTMSRGMREKKAERLSRILTNIRKIRAERRKPSTTSDIPDKNTATREAVSTPSITPPAEIKRDIKATTIPTKTFDLLNMVEEITKSSVSSIMDIISGNYSYMRAQKSSKIEILQEMLKRIEIIKNQRKKEYTNV